MSTKKRHSHRKKESPKENKESFFKTSGASIDNGASFFNPVQTKLKIGAPGDKYEKQADAMADKVVNTPANSPAVQSKEGESKVQRQGMEEEAQAKLQKQGQEEEVQTQLQKQEEEEAQAKLQRQEEEEMQTKLQRQEEEEAQAKLQKQEEEEAQAKLQRQEEEEAQTKLQRQEEEEAQTKLQRQEEEESVQAQVQRKEETDAKPSFEKKLASTKGGGSPLPKEVRDEMEQKFGTTFRKVKIHTDPLSFQLCEEINAQAFTKGNHIYFNKGKYAPTTHEGKILLAHELTHVVQQRGSM